MQFEHLQPGGDFLAERSDFDAFKESGVEREARMRFAEQGGGTLRVVALEMMEGGGHLNERLEERPLGFAGKQPDTLPVFVS